jgi:hypothetical protein
LVIVPGGRRRCVHMLQKTAPELGANQEQQHYGGKREFAYRVDLNQSLSERIVDGEFGATGTEA